MLETLKIDWLKLKYYQTFWILLGLFCISLPALTFFARTLFNKDYSNIPAGVHISSPFNFPEVWQTVSYLAGFILVIPAILNMKLIAVELTFRLQRQNILDGLSRIQLMHAKFLMVFLLSVIFSVMVGIVSAICGFYGNTAFSFTNSWYIFHFFCQCLSYSMLAVIFSLYIKNVSLAISSFIIYAWVIEKSLARILNSITSNNLGNYLPLSSADKLIPIPFLKDIAAKTNEFHSFPIILLTVSIYLIIYYLLAIHKITNEDV